MKPGTRRRRHLVDCNDAADEFAGIRHLAGLHRDDGHRRRRRALCLGLCAETPRQKASDYHAATCHACANLHQGSHQGSLVVEQASQNYTSAEGYALHQNGLPQVSATQTPVSNWRHHHPVRGADSAFDLDPLCIGCDPLIQPRPYHFIIAGVAGAELERCRAHASCGIIGAGRLAAPSLTALWCRDVPGGHHTARRGGSIADPRRRGFLLGGYGGSRMALNAQRCSHAAARCRRQRSRRRAWPWLRGYTRKAYATRETPRCGQG